MKLEDLLKRTDLSPEEINAIEQGISDNAALTLALTDSKKREEQIIKSSRSWRTIFDSLSDAIWLLDNDYSIQRANKSAAELFGYDIKSIIGKHCWEVVHKTTEPIPECPFHKTSQSHRRETVGLKLNSRDYLVIVDPIRKEDRLIGAVHIMSDVTESKQLEEQIRRHQKRESIEILVGGIVHDFNNLLAATIGNLELAKLKYQLTNGPIDDALKSCFRAAELIERLRGISKPAVSEKKALDIYSVADDVYKAVKPIIPHNIRLDLDVSPNEFYVLSNQTELHEIILNLTKNASRAIEEKGILEGKIKLTATSYKIGTNGSYGLPPGDYVHLIFEDNGIGMDEGVLTNAFEPMFTTKPKDFNKGCGLGLAIVYTLVTQSHGGAVNIETEKGVGTKVHVYLKRTQRPVLTEIVENERNPVDGKKVLFVDDEAMLRKIAEAGLTANGYEVITASDGDEGVKTYFDNQKDISVVVLDLKMPKKPGDEVLREITDKDPGAKIIIASGFGDEYMRQPEFARAAGILKKPYQLKNLIDAIEKAKAKE